MIGSFYNIIYPKVIVGIIIILIAAPVGRVLAPQDNLLHNPKTSKIHKSDRFIDYVFPYEIDSLLAVYYRKSDHQNPYIQFWVPSYSGLHFILFLEDNTPLHYPFIPDSLGSHFPYKDDIFYFYTNRYAVVNKGEFYIPIIFSFDGIFSPVGDRSDFTRRSASTGYSDFIKFESTDPSNWDKNWDPAIRK